MDGGAGVPEGSVPEPERETGEKHLRQGLIAFVVGLGIKAVLDAVDFQPPLLPSAVAVGVFLGAWVLIAWARREERPFDQLPELQEAGATGAEPEPLSPPRSG